MQIIYDCNECPRISITEKEQQEVGNQFDHICGMSGKKIYHRGKHPILQPPDDCIFSENYKT